MLKLAEILIGLFADTFRWLRLSLRSSRSIKAENLFLRRQLALYIERGVKPRRIDSVTRIGLTVLSRLFTWQDALVVVRPATLIRWHRAGWKLFWRLKSRPGRPPIPLELQALIRRIARENPSWGEERMLRPRCDRIVADDRGPRFFQNRLWSKPELPAYGAVLAIGRRPRIVWPRSSSQILCFYTASVACGHSRLSSTSWI